MGPYLLANLILGVPAVIAAVLISRKQKVCDRCELCKHLRRINPRPLGSSYRYECAKNGLFDKQPDYCSDWIARDTK